MEEKVLKSIDMKDFVRFYSKYDMASKHELEKAENVIRCFDFDTEYTDVNEVIELYNIKQYFNNEMCLQTWDDLTKNKYVDIVKQFDGIIGRFFSKITGNNIYEIFQAIHIRYKYDFWELIDYYGVYKRVLSDQFKTLVNENRILDFILPCQKIVRYFGLVIAEELIANVKYAETILDIYARENKKDSTRLYLPTELTSENKKTIVQNYIAWEEANPNYLLLLSTLKKCDDLAIDDRIRYFAYQKYQEYWNNESNTQNMVWYKYGANVSFYDDSKEQQPNNLEHDENILEFSYGISWINENLDYPTLLNNFIYLFNFVDEQFRYQHISNPSKLGVIEKFFGVSGRNNYKTGMDYQMRRISSICQMQGYLRQLERNNIKLEDIFKWFFEVYLEEEFNVKDFKYFTPSENSTYLEKILILITQFDSVIKQFRFYIEDKKIDRAFFEFSSTQYKLSDTPSMIEQKYVYPKSDRISTAMHMCYSDQSLLCYLDEENEYNCLPGLLVKRQIRLSDFSEYEQIDIKWLIDEGFAFLDNQQYVKMKLEIAYLLRDLFENGVISYSFYKEKIPSVICQIKNWIENGDLEAKQTLFTVQEQKFIDYMLNVQKYDNGPELRNKYAHGSFPVDLQKQENDYIELLRIMVLIIIKINEEFCVINSDCNPVY